MKGFRYDIGFLRAISVLAVVMYHYKIPFFKGGFIGVDVFFVISGFLMTKIILNGFDKDTFSLVDFYSKRIKRIVPVLLFVTVIILLAAQGFLIGADLRLTSKYAFLSNIFVSNIYYWLFNGYFDPASQDNMFLHTWSLGVEWQFYLIFPVLLLMVRGLYKKNLSLFRYVFIIITFFSFFLNILLLKWDSDFCFYMFPTRAWEMLCGGMSFLLADKVLHLKISYKRYIALLCYLLIFLCVIFFNDSFLWPSIYSLLPVFSASFILLINQNFSFLRNRIAQFFGNISYSLYLWHWPLYVLMVYLGKENFFNAWSLIIASVLLAYFSYYYIESRKTLNRVSFILASSCGILIFSGFLYVYPINILSKNLSIHTDKVFDIINFNEKYYSNGGFQKQFNSCGCFIQHGKATKFNYNNCLKIDKTKQNILLIGDSHSAQLSLSLREKMALNEINVLEASAGHALPVIKTKGVKKSRDLMDYVFDKFIPENRKNIDLVVVSAHWMRYKSPKIGYDRDELVKKLEEIIKYFSTNNIDYLIIGQTASYDMAFPKLLGLYPNEINQHQKQDGKVINDLLMSIFPQENYLDVYNYKLWLNNNMMGSDNVPYMLDDNHLSKLGADQLINYVLQCEKLKIICK